jgi:hypothetical protein
MRTIAAESMPKLPADVVSLVAQGVYSLFELKGSAAKYLLTTPQPAEFYLLDEEGGIAVDPRITSVKGAPIVAAISFAPREPSSDTNGFWALPRFAVGELK